MQVRLLGPVDVTAGGQARAISGLHRTASPASKGASPTEVLAAEEKFTGGKHQELTTWREVIGSIDATRGRLPTYLTTNARPVSRLTFGCLTLQPRPYPSSHNTAVLPCD